MRSPVRLDTLSILLLQLTLLQGSMPANALPLLRAAQSLDLGQFATPYGVAAADFNLDGYPDIVSANWGTLDASILLGSPDVKFTRLPNLPIADAPVDVATGLLNDDQYPDVIVATPIGISVWLTNGTGGSDKDRIDCAVDGTVAVAVGDLTGDEVPDLVTANGVVGTVTVLVSEGGESFSIRDTLQSEGDPGDVALGDLDGNDVAEIVVSNWGGASISVFQDAKSSRSDHTVPAGPQGVVVHDLNGDGWKDVAVACFAAHVVAVLMNDGSGDLLPAVTYATGQYPGSLGVADLNGDAIADLVTTNEYLGPSISVLLGTGSGTFEESRNVAVGSIPHGVVLEDFDGDDSYDLATTGLNEDAVLLYMGDGNGAFMAREDHTVGLEPRSVAVASMLSDGDGLPDLVTANEADNSVTVLINKGEDGFIVGDYAVGSGPIAVAVGDLSGDGCPDVVTANWLGYTLSILRGNPEGTLQPSATVGMNERPYAVAIGDLNGDGHRDIVTGNRATETTGSIAILMGYGDGTFHPTAYYGTNGPSYGVAIGDLDGDSFADVAAANYANGVSVFRGHGDGTLAAPVTYSVSGSPRALILADVNGDDDLDVITANSTGGTVSILLGDGAGGLAPPVYYVVSYSPSFVSAGDLNGDGNTDLAVANLGASVVSVLLGDAGNFPTRLDFGASRNVSSTAIEDMNGDAMPDVVATNLGSGSISILWGAEVGGGPQPVSRRTWEGPSTRPGGLVPRVSPNPLRASGTLVFRTARGGPVNLRVYDVRGRVVQTTSLAHTSPGAQEIQVDGRDRMTGALPAGIYFFEIRTPDGAAHGKFCVIK